MESRSTYLQGRNRESDIENICADMVGGSRVGGIGRLRLILRYTHTHTHTHTHTYTLCSFTHSCPTLCDPMDCSPPGSSVHGDSLDKNTEVDSQALLQGIFPTQELNSGLLHCRQILYHLGHWEAHGYTLPRVK